jgi:eukaryotic-like serine/threonine-protein kinase
MSILRQASLQFTQPEVGDSLDTFILRSQLHQGAMATLFLAEDQLSREQVVLKIPCGDILNKPILLYHYQNEERISRIIDHPGIIRFIHRQRSRQYIIMEYAPGRDLRSLTGKNRISELDTALSLLRQLCDIVIYLHDMGVVHLDLKPENIILTRDSSIKVIDFGLASCCYLPDLLATDLKNPQGTPWYIAPEQLLGERSDPRCDIYSMGMLLYEMLTGQLPWPRSSKVHIARRRLRHDPTPPRYFNHDIPPQIQEIVLRAIARHSEDRYSNVKDMQEDLKYWQQRAVTTVGCNSKKQSFLQRLFPGKAIQEPLSRPLKTEAKTAKTQIIGALIDYSGLDHMLIELKTQALIRSADVTLVHVIEEESDSHFRRYSITVEGEQLMARLERAVQLFRRCSIDPGIRLLRGEVVEMLRRLCAELDAELLVLGTSRKKEGFLRSASVRRRLQKDRPCPLVVAKEEVFLPAVDLVDYDPRELTAQQVLVCDIFLVNLWYDHLHYHTDLIYQMLLKSKKEVDINEEQCLFSSFSASLKNSSHWQYVISILEPAQLQFHQLSMTMIQLPENDHTGLYDLYKNELLPLFCKFKKDLSDISVYLRSHVAEPPPPVGFLSDNVCPVAQPDLACYGPLLRVMNLDQDLCVLIQDKNKNASSPDLVENP